MKRCSKCGSVLSIPDNKDYRYEHATRNLRSIIEKVFDVKKKKEK